MDLWQASKTESCKENEIAIDSVGHYDHEFKPGIVGLKDQLSIMAGRQTSRT